MDTLMRDSKAALPGVKRMGHRAWYTLQAKACGHILSDKISKHVAIEARVDHGRWIVDCPLKVEKQPCMGAENATEDEKFFLCLSCGNAQIDGEWIKVKFPPKKQREKFEKSLAVRPEAFRNWFPGETAKKIAKENKQHGIEIPEGAI